MNDQQPETERQTWMRLLALARWEDLKTLAASIDPEPFTVLRPPESGLVMLRGRIGGDGAQFNFGEATATRCCVRSASGHEGHGYVLGRTAEHARVAAMCDALLQDERSAPAVKRDIIAPLQALLANRRRVQAQKAAATKVEFFTMVRGDV